LSTISGAAGSQRFLAAGHHPDAAVVSSSSSWSSDTRDTDLSPQQLTVYQSGGVTARNSVIFSGSLRQKAQQPTHGAAVDAVFGSADSWEASLDLTP
jgi:hypothetical protein